MENAHGTKRRKALAIGVAVIGGALTATTARAQAQKVAQAQAQYQDSPKNGQQCSDCVQFQPPSSCKLVDGKIDPKGWCMFFVKKPS